MLAKNTFTRHCMTPLYDIELVDIDGNASTLDEYRGHVLLVVNTASQCGFTPQYKGLQTLQSTYADRGFAVLGFPCNQFGQQEPGTDGEIAAFCETRFGVSFPMFSKVDVNGSQAHPLFVRLKEEAPGLLGSTAIKWNFTKFLVDRRGNVVSRFAPKDAPAKIAKAIEALLEESA